MQIWKQEPSLADTTNDCCGSRLKTRHRHHGHNTLHMMRPWQHRKENGCTSMQGAETIFLDFCLRAWTFQYE
eukprot:7633175-Karenia_brevis.AAC.1